MNKAIIAAGIVIVMLIGGAVVYVTTSGNPKQEEVVVSVPTPEVQGETTVDQAPTEIATTAAEPTKSMKSKQYTSAPPMTINAEKTYTATIVTDKGAMKLGLFAKENPVTVNNFVFLAREGFYNDTIFHRVIAGFMIQGGDPLGTGTGSPGYRFADEKITRDYTRGTIAMANSGPNTNGSQFFIMHATYGLPKNYVIFGAIDPSDAASMATLDAIAATPVRDSGTGETSSPVTPPRVASVTIEEK